MRVMPRVSLVSMAIMASLLAGACAPRAKPYAVAGGAVLSVAGTAMFIDATSTRCETGDPLGDLLVAPACQTGVAFGSMLGVLTLVTGVGLMIAAAAGPSEPTAEPSSLPSAAPPAPQPPVPLSWPPGPPARSPSAPSGSPLAFD